MDTTRPAAKHYGWDSEMPRCLSARKKLQEHQLNMALIQVAKERRPLTASEEDSNQDARHS